MIVSASRRTDLPAFYSEWFANRLRAGFCLVPNPFNPRQVARVSLTPDKVDAFVFWTRNPTPFLPVLDQLDALGHCYVFLVTLTGYGPPLEPYAPPVADALAAIHRLAARIGPERIAWRYDPIVLGPGLEPQAHVERFADLAGRLAGAASRVKTSFVDLYRKTCRRIGRVEPAYLQDPAMSEHAAAILLGIKNAATAAGIVLVETCAEEADWSWLGVPPGACVDAAWLGRLFGRQLPAAKDPGQRGHCRCAPSRDIGVTDSCPHGCVYCYATVSQEAAVASFRRHDPNAESLRPIVRG